MEGLVIFIIVVALICSGIGSAHAYISTHPTEVAFHLHYWQQIYFVGGYLLYVGLISCLTARHFKPATVSISLPSGHWSAQVGRFVLRPMAACAISGLFLLGAMWLEGAFHLPVPSWPFRLGLMIVGAFFFTFWPGFFLEAAAVFLVLIHIRTAYLVIAAILLLASTAVVAGLSAIVLLMPFAFYAGIGCWLFDLNRSGDTPTMAIVLAVGGVALLITTSRWVWVTVNRIISGPIWGISVMTRRAIEQWRGACVAFYADARKLPLFAAQLFDADVS